MKLQQYGEDGDSMEADMAESATIMNYESRSNVEYFEKMN
jgi:hypothetical protein